MSYTEVTKAISSRYGNVIQIIFRHTVEIGRSLADAEVRPNVRLGNMWLFGWSSAELRQTFGVICGFALAAFCARHWR